MFDQMKPEGEKKYFKQWQNHMKNEESDMPWMKWK